MKDFKTKCVQAEATDKELQNSFVVPGNIAPSATNMPLVCIYIPNSVVSHQSSVLHLLFSPEINHIH